MEICHNYIAGHSISTKSTDDPASIDILKSGKSTSREDEKRTTEPTGPQLRFYHRRQWPLYAAQGPQMHRRPFLDVEHVSPSDSGKSMHRSIMYHHPHVHTKYV